MATGSEIWKEFLVDGVWWGYMISNQGRVMSTKDNTGKSKRRERILNIHKDRVGYCVIRISHNGSKKSLIVHRLVAAEFVENKHGHKEVNHKDGDKSNNTYDNLEWCSRQENIRHAIYSGLLKFKYGKEHHRTRPIIATSLDGTRTISYHMQRAAIRDGFAQGNISACIRGTRNHYKGFHWQYL